MTKQEFYIGWQEKSPPAFARKSKTFVWLVGLIVPFAALLFVFGQQGFSTAQFEFGQTRTLEGILVYDPAPMLQVPLGGGQWKSILLVDFGKFGAEKSLRSMEENAGKSLAGAAVKLSGTLIYYDGKTLLELTDGPASWQGPGKLAENFAATPVDLGLVTVRGEIADPKCFFGVMKPGYGKPHRSCAIRCISGGIPPVLKVENKTGEANYFLLKGPGGEAINEVVLDFVGDQIQLCGNLRQENDWLVMQVDLDEGIKRLRPYWLGDAVMCAEK